MNHRDTETRRILNHRSRDKKLSVFIRVNLWFHFLKISAPLCLCGLIFAFNVKAQDLPDEIRGYKVQRVKVSVQTPSDAKKTKENLGVEVKFDRPELVEITPLGATLEVFAELTVFGQSAKIDFLTFRDFRAGGLKIEIEEYKEAFEIEKNKPLRLKKPVRVFISATQAVKGGVKEFLASQNEWQVTGRVFVFGKFRKIGFHFKRVVPVEVNLKINNPLKTDRAVTN
jgi:hypothetical protein